jgi:Protein of unknown function (DUF4058)
MPSPFPGMDPWLERPSIFPDLHDSLIATMRTAINALLPPPYFTAIANRIWVEETDRHIEPDVDVLRPPVNNGSPGSAAAVVDAVAVKPVIIRVPREEVVERFLEIHSAPDGEHLVTTIEVLSLSNKRQGSRGRREYLRKQRKMLDRKVNLVEFDLLRQGRHTTSVALRSAIEKTGSFDYHVCVHRFHKPEEYEVYPVLMPQPLPEVAIPLMPEIPVVVINLQELMSQCYDAGLYSRRIRYAEHQPEPPLTEEQSRWTNRVLREKGLQG